MTNIILFLILSALVVIVVFMYRINKSLSSVVKMFVKTGEHDVTEDFGEPDELFESAKEIILQFDFASASLLQRRLNIGYARAARIMDELASEGFVEPANGSKPRKVIKPTGV